MNQQLLATLRASTLAAMAADLSQELAEEYDSETTSSAQWDAMKSDLDAIVSQLAALDDDFVELLMEEGADPEVIFEGRLAL